MIKLEFAELARKPIWILDKPVHIGSDKHNQLTLKNPSVSPRHATISRENGNYLLKDHNSEAGTFVNGERIGQRSIKNGDVIRFGHVQLKVSDVLENSAGFPIWTLIACSSQAGGQEYPLEPKTGHRSIKVGRADHCDLNIPETWLSREHALLELEADGVRITDLSTAAGTYINDQKITQGIARSGDRIRFDIYNFVLIGPAGAGDEINTVPENHAEMPVASSQAAVVNPGEEAMVEIETGSADMVAQQVTDTEAELDETAVVAPEAVPVTEEKAVINEVELHTFDEEPPKASFLPLVIAGSLLSAAIAAAVFLVQS